MESLFKIAIQDMPGFSEAAGMFGGILSAALTAGAAAAVFGMLSILINGLMDTLKYLFFYRKKPEVMCTVSKLKDIKINYSLNETKSRDFIYLVTATVENQECTFEYTKTMKKEKECTIKEGDSFLAYIDTKKQKAENSTAMKKEVKKNIIMFGICALVVIVFLLLLQQK